MKGSRFIAVTHPVADFERAVALRDAERRRFRDATHHVFAALLRSGAQRFDDDGEPAGSAGRPSLASIQKSGMSDIVVIVTRYFGGTKLGTGGLGRAYAAAADLALASTPSRRVVSACRVSITHTYDDTGAVSRSVESAGGQRVRESYGDVVDLEVAVPVEDLEQLLADVAEATAGRARCRDLPGELLLPVDT